MSVTLNVRCCCEPLKVLGTMDVPRIDPRFRRFWYTFCKSRPLALHGRARSSVETETVDVWVRWFEYGDGNGEWAVYSDDRPVEFWRRFRQFKEGAHV